MVRWRVSMTGCFLLQRLVSWLNSGEKGWKASYCLENSQLQLSFWILLVVILDTAPGYLNCQKQTMLAPECSFALFLRYQILLIIFLLLLKFVLIPYATPSRSNHWKFESEYWEHVNLIPFQWIICVYELFKVLCFLNHKILLLMDGI